MAKSSQYKRPGGYLRKWEEVVKSPAYRDLKPPARCLLEELQRICWGRNGQIGMSTKRASELINVSEPTASKAFYDLVAHGFIVLTKGHLWQERQAREWRITCEPSGNNREPTDEWQNWNPDKPFPVPFRKKSRPKKQGQHCSRNKGSLLKNQGQSSISEGASH